jgi:hypothetical protein
MPDARINPTPGTIVPRTVRASIIFRYDTIMISPVLSLRKVA